MKRLIPISLFATFAALPMAAFAAADSYRWLHVTIDTPWMIFLFLLPMVLIPAVLMAVLYWKFAGRPAVELEKKKVKSKTPAAPVADKNESTD